MNSQLIISTCGVFAAILALALNFYTKHETINRNIKITFIILLSIVLAVFAYALSSTEVVNSAPKNANLMPDKLSPQEAGTTITWTATALDPENDRIQYKFLLDSQQRTDWSYDSTWNWTTSSVDIGSHTIECKVKDGNHNVDGDDSKDIEFTITNRPPLINELTPTPNSPQPACATITWTTDATDPDNDQISYEYLLNGKSETIWSIDNLWNWSTSEGNIGENQIEVHIRDGKHAGPDNYDAARSVVFIITKVRLSNLPPMVVSLMPDKMNPQVAGTSIKWTATALDPEKDPVQYKFLLDGQQKTDWSYDSTWYWTTSNTDIGSHMIEIKVKDGNHNPDGDDTKDFDFTISIPNDSAQSVRQTDAPIPGSLDAELEGTRQGNTVYPWLAKHPEWSQFSRTPPSDIATLPTTWTASDGTTHKINWWDSNTGDSVDSAGNRIILIYDAETGQVKIIPNDPPRELQKYG